MQVPPLLVQAVSLHQQGRFQEAAAAYERVLGAQPDNFDALHLLGVLLSQARQFESAENLLTRAIRVNPASADARYNRGLLFKALNRDELALADYTDAIRINPAYVSAHNNRARILNDLGRFAEAKESAEQAIRLDPKHFNAFNNKGNALKGIGQFAEAVASYEEAIRLKPDFAEAYSNRGVALQELRRLTDAIASQDQAILLAPDYAGAHYNRGNALIELGQPNAAIASYNKAIAINPGYAEAHWNKSLALLLKGDFGEGFRLYEWRWKVPENDGRERGFSQPLWLGAEPLKGKTVLLHSEQGLGDAIQFCRYAALVAELGAKVVVEVPKALVGLLSGLKGVTELVERGGPLPPFDFHCPLLSLPLAFRTNIASIPDGSGYLRSDAGKVADWSRRLGPKTDKRIGIVWSGRVEHKNDRNRSIPFSQLVGYLPPNFEYVSLQNGARDSDREVLKAHPEIRFYGDQLQDFSDTAALVELMDAVVSVDTSVAHLAGALGKTVWVLLPFNPDWRWMLDRTDSPWYPTARLFRQESIGDWDHVLEKLGTELSGLASGLSGNDRGVQLPAGGRPGQPVINRWESPGAADAHVDDADSMKGPVDAGEVDRRKLAVQQKRTDLERWANPGQLEAAWEARSALAADWVQAGSRVLDIGCGAMKLEKYLPFGCVYMPSDVVSRDSRTIVADLNEDGVPESAARDADVVVMLGVLEYLFAPQEAIAAVYHAGTPVICSYCPREITAHLDRGALGWVNNFTLDEFLGLVREAGYAVAVQRKIDAVQYLFKLVKAPAVLPRKTQRIHVISYNNVGNFGDRLGFHLINDLLPVHAEVSWGSIKPLGELPGPVDMLIVGIGNSLFGSLINDALIRAAEQARVSIGIFGTQYREAMPDANMKLLLDRLAHWYARYEDDAMIYGRGRNNVSHLGDWLINAFPMARGVEDSVLSIGDEIWQDLPLDRTIQKIQRYRNVFSTRLHPLLCALTSADVVGYAEQRESGNPDVVSGKFRSMTMDVFGQAFPEHDLWSVDRDKVAAYKDRVRTGIGEMRGRIERLLG